MYQSPFFRRNLGLGTLTLCTLLLLGCNSKPITVDAPPPPMAQTSAPVAAPPTSVAPSEPIPVGDVPENMLDWDGTYQAILPCSDCPGLAMSVQLRADKTAVVRVRKTNVSDATLFTTYSGPFRFQPTDDSMIALRKDATSTAAYRFFVSENWIELRDPNTGNALSPAKAYRLKKTSLSE